MAVNIPWALSGVNSVQQNKATVMVRILCQNAFKRQILYSPQKKKTKKKNNAEQYQNTLAYEPKDQLLILTNELLLTIEVKGAPKARFSVATTTRCRGGRYSFPWITPLYPLYVPYNAEC